MDSKRCRPTVCYREGVVNGFASHVTSVNFRRQCIACSTLGCCRFCIVMATIVRTPDCFDESALVGMRPFERRALIDLGCVALRRHTDVQPALHSYEEYMIYLI